MNYNSQKYTVSKVGYIGVAPHRYLDVINNEDIDKFKLYYFDNEQKNFEAIENLLKRYFPQNLKKFEGFKLPWPTLYTSIVNELANHKKKNDSITVAEVFSNFPNAFYKFIRDSICCTDILWVGDNDFDSSFIFATLLGSMGIKYALSLKETRFNPSIFELEAIKNSRFLILPHEQYIDFFKQKYSVDLSNKSIFADIDWRSKAAHEILKNSNVEKLSQKDGKIHVVILSGRVVWNKNESRSQGRYYYVPIIKELIQKDFVVHLHTKALLESVDNPVYYEPNPYSQFLSEYPNNFIIEKPLDLNDIENYKILMKYDLGLLNSGIGGKDEFQEFEKINIPNRFYEYLFAKVIPISPTGILEYMELNFNNKVIFFKDASELKTLCSNLNPKSYEFEKYFDDFVRLMLTKSSQLI